MEDLDQLVCLFTKSLSNVDVTERLAFPVGLVGHIWAPNDQAREKNIRVLDRFGEVWDLQARMRWDHDNHRKPEVYGREWKRFINKKGLRAGDQLFFYRPRDPNPRQVIFIVGTKREVTLMGARAPP